MLLKTLSAGIIFAYNYKENELDLYRVIERTHLWNTWDNF